MKNRLISALFAYLALAVLAAFTLDGGLLRNAVWVVMGALAVKSYVAYRAGWADKREDESPVAQDEASGLVQPAGPKHAIDE